MLFPVLISILLLAPAPQPAGVSDSLDERILAAAQSVLAARYPSDVSRMEVKLVRTSSRLEADADVSIQLPEATALPRAHLKAKVSQLMNGKWIEKGWVMLYVAHFDSVGVAARLLKKDEQITGEDIRFVWLETTRYRGTPLTPMVMQKLLAGGEIYAHRHLAKSRALRTEDVRNALDVSLGQSVIMIYKRNQFVLEFTCKARQQGFAGEEIKLFAPATNRTYRARILEPGKAEWLETLP